MIYWTIKTIVGGGGVHKFVSDYKDEIRTFTHTMVSAPILQRMIDRKLDSTAAKARTTNLGTKRYYAMFADLPKQIAADVRASVARSKKVTIEVILVKDASGRDITNHSTHFRRTNQSSRETEIGPDALCGLAPPCLPLILTAEAC